MPTFEIPDGPTTVALKRSGDAKNPGPATGAIVFNVTNRSGDACDGRLGVVVSGGSKESWFAIDGDRERTFAGGETQTATIRVSAPPDVAEGSYPFRLRAVAVNDPDNDHAEGPVATAKVPPLPTPTNGHIPWWVWAIGGAVVLLLLIGALWFAFHDRTPKQPAEPMGALEIGSDRPGSDFGMVKLANAEECSKLCQAYGPCRAVTFIPQSGLCMIKNAVPNKTANPQTISAAKSSPTK